MPERTPVTLTNLAHHLGTLARVLDITAQALTQIEKEIER